MISKSQMILNTQKIFKHKSITIKRFNKVIYFLIIKFAYIFKKTFLIFFILYRTYLHKLKLILILNKCASFKLKRLETIYIRFKN